VKNFVYQLKSIKTVSNNIALALLIPKTESLNFQAGQYLEILYPDKSYQPFSIANAPQSHGNIELHIRHLATDFATESMLSLLKQQKQLFIRGACGNSFYRQTPANPIIILAGGTGFAYAKSIVEQAIINNDQRPLHLYWGVKTISDFYLPDLPYVWMQKLTNFHYTAVISQPKSQENWSGKTGYAQQVIVSDHPDLTSFQVYASGPPAMMSDAFKLFQKHGLKKEFMHSDSLFARSADKYEATVVQA
jgi:CDP-4-dehydro-6-deoxyglucose reductase